MNGTPAGSGPAIAFRADHRTAIARSCSTREFRVEIGQGVHLLHGLFDNVLLSIECSHPTRARPLVTFQRSRVRLPAVSINGP